MVKNVKEIQSNPVSATETASVIAIGNDVASPLPQTEQALPLVPNDIASVDIHILEASVTYDMETKYIHQRRSIFYLATALSVIAAFSVFYGINNIKELFSHGLIDSLNTAVATENVTINDLTEQPITQEEDPLGIFNPENTTTPFDLTNISATTTSSETTIPTETPAPTETSSTTEAPVVYPVEELLPGGLCRPLKGTYNAKVEVENANLIKISVLPADQNARNTINDGEFKLPVSRKDFGISCLAPGGVIDGQFDTQDGSGPGLLFYVRADALGIAGLRLDDTQHTNFTLGNGVLAFMTEQGGESMETDNGVSGPLQIKIVRDPIPKPVKTTQPNP